MKKKLLCLLIILSFFAGACSTIKVSADFDNSIDFAKYKTYFYLGWSKNSSELLNDLDKKRIESAFNNAFQTRGMTYVKTGGDIEVSLYLVTDKKTAMTAYTDYYGGYGGYSFGHSWGWGRGFATTTYHQYDYTVGTLVCDVIDHENKNLMWQGVGSGTVSEASAGRKEKIAAAVNKIMALYPVTSAQ